MAAGLVWLSQEEVEELLAILSATDRTPLVASLVEKLERAEEGHLRAS